jgi:hypothetical protein
VTTETINWTAPGEQMPDADTTVLIRVEGASEPVWPGYFDGGVWRYADGMPVRGRVIEWTDMPVGTGTPDGR